MNQENIRNFCIIAHIDHGKSTLADRFLEVSGTVESREMREQVLDQMDIERERGITIKLQPVRLNYQLKTDNYQLNLIDTPGHVDFSYEVSRSLAACEGAVLVVDASQGIQAQTLANINLALDHDLSIIPVINKIDLPNAQPEDVAQELMDAFGFELDEILFASAKTGEGVEEILQSIVKTVPAPKGDKKKPLQALIFDSVYDRHKGVIVYVRVFNGELFKSDEVQMMAAGIEAEANSLGYFSPSMVEGESISSGEVGFITTGLRDVEKARVGDTITLKNNPADKPLPGYREVKPMVYASIFPSSGDDYPLLRDAMEKLKLNDASLSYEPENIPSIGFGFRCGFLGLLHMEIVQERLTREFDLDLVLTAPSVAYKVKSTDGTEETIYNPSSLPDPSEIESIAEPWAGLEILTPEEHIGSIMELVTTRRGDYQTTKYLGKGRVQISFEVPLANIISDFYDRLKSATSGYASMNYEVFEFREEDLVRVDILVAGDRVDAFSFIAHADEAEAEGRLVVKKLKDIIPKQQFAVALQAAIGGKVIARETIPALRKDVTSKLYGGDVTRKKKLLEKQKAGKKRLKKMGKVDIPQDAFLAVMRRNQ